MTTKTDLATSSSKMHNREGANNSLHFLDVLLEKEGADFLPAFTGNQHLLGNKSVGIPLAQRQEILALLKL